MRPAWLGLLALAAFAVLAGACGDDGGSEQTEASTAATSFDCPFDAEELGDAIGTPMEDAGGCSFVEEGRSIDGPTNQVVLVNELDAGDSTLSELSASFADDPTTLALPELGDDAFVRTFESSSTPETDDIIYQADVYLDLDGTEVTVSLLGATTEEQGQDTIDAVVSLLAG